MKQCLTAFPVDRFATKDGVFTSTGMTLRDYFAGQAIQGAADVYLDDDARPCHLQNHDFQIIAVNAYLIADAMLKAREESSAD